MEVTNKTEVKTITEHEVLIESAKKWKYIAVPEDELDKHSDCFAKIDENVFQNKFNLFKSTSSEKLLGARVRGKMHKHNGTNCDDWFEFETIRDDNCVVITVSDGAGSKKLSRIGAKLSCETAIKQLKNDLIDINKKELKRNVLNSTIKDSLLTIESKDNNELNKICTAIHNAFEAAYNAVVYNYNNFKNNSDYIDYVGRELTLSDFASTLLLTIGIKFDDDYLFISSQIGDGMTAIINEKYETVLLGVADSGEFSGETDFLISFDKLKDKLWDRTFVYFGKMQALLSMTDGVADDYFPNKTELARLFLDLKFNGIINNSLDNKNEIDRHLQGTEIFAPLLIPRIIEIQENSEYPSVPIYSATKFLNLFKININEITNKNEQIQYINNNIIHDSSTSSKEKLIVWLDSYLIRGSFDDRTLVVLYKE